MMNGHTAVPRGGEQGGMDNRQDAQKEKKNENAVCDYKKTGR